MTVTCSDKIEMGEIIPRVWTPVRVRVKLRVGLDMKSSWNIELKIKHVGAKPPPNVSSELGLYFQDGGRTRAQRLLGVKAVSMGAKKMLFLGNLVPNT